MTRVPVVRRTQKEPRLRPGEQWLNEKAAAWAGVRPGVYAVPKEPPPGRQPLQWEVAEAHGLQLHRAIPEPFTIVWSRGRPAALAYGNAPDVVSLGAFPDVGGAKDYAAKLVPVIRKAQANGVEPLRFLRMALGGWA